MILKIIDEYKKKLDITFNSNKKYWISSKFIKSYFFIRFRYIWAIGDDDLLMPNSLSFKNLFENYEEEIFST